MRLLSLFITLVAVLSGTTRARGQVRLPGDTVRWEASAYIKHDGDSVDLSQRSRFTFYGNTQVRWQPLDDAGVSAARGKTFRPYVYVYKVTEVSDSLLLDAATGIVTYRVTCKGQTGSIQVKKNGPVYTLHLTMERGDGTVRDRDYDLSGYTILHQ